jgi:hypothetical protein
MEETKENRVEYKIYQIVCNQTGEIYIGKTTRTLEIRLYYHKKFLDCTSKQIIERGDYKIEEIDSTFNEEESVKLERFYIETFECVNKLIPGRTNKEYYEEHKEVKSEYHKKWREEHKEELAEKKKDYYEAHKEEIAEKAKEYREAHKEKIAEKKKEWKEAHKEEIAEKQKKYYQENREKFSERQKEYYEKNKEEIVERQKDYYEKNKEKIIEKRKEKYTCECGSTLTTGHKVRHERSQKHIDYINSKK